MKYNLNSMDYNDFAIQKNSNISLESFNIYLSIGSINYKIKRIYPCDNNTKHKNLNITCQYISVYYFNIMK